MSIFYPHLLAATYFFVGNSFSTGNMARVIDHMPSKHVALSSSPSAAQKRERKKSWGRGGMVQWQCLPRMHKALVLNPAL